MIKLKDVGLFETLPDIAIVLLCDPISCPKK